MTEIEKLSSSGPSVKVKTRPRTMVCNGLYDCTDLYGIESKQTSSRDIGQPMDITAQVLSATEEDCDKG